LEEECCFRGVLSDGGDVPADLMSAQWPFRAMCQLSAPQTVLSYWLLHLLKDPTTPQVCHYTTL